MPIQFTVFCLPGPQGSKSYKGTGPQGRAILAESSALVKPWREAVVWAAREAMVLAQTRGIGGGVAIEAVFTVRRPIKLSKKIMHPTVKPDIDKLVRSTLDALTAAGVIEDDARVVRLLTEKSYPNQHRRSLDVPGAWISITPIHESEELPC